MTELSNKEYHSGSWFKRILKAGIFSGLGLIGYANATQEPEEYPKQVEDFGLADTTTSDTTSSDASKDSLKQVQQDSLFNLNAREWFLSEIPNLWYTFKTDSLGNIYVYGVSYTNNPRNIRHAENTEEAHTGGGIPHQLVFSNGIKQFITFDNLKEIGRASLQSVVRTKDFQVKLEDVVIDTVGNFDIKYNGRERDNFIPRSLDPNGIFLLLYADRPGEITTQLVIEKKVYEEIYERKLKGDEEERNRIIKEVADALAKNIKLDTLTIRDTKIEKEPVVFLGVSSSMSKQGYSLDFVLDLNERIYGIRRPEGYLSWLLHLGASHDKIRRDSYESISLGRNQRYLHQEREVKTDGLIPRLGVGISINSNRSIGGEFSILRELFRDYIERVNEEVRNPGGSLYKVNENYVKYTKEKPRTLIYGGARFPLGKDFFVRAGIQTGRMIKPQYSLGISRPIWSKRSRKELK